MSATRRNTSQVQFGAAHMEEIMTPLRPTPLAMHGDSRGITKLKPKIRVVHIFAPKIIKTEPANFRELVQRLTGKPTKRLGGRRKAVAEEEGGASRCSSRSTGEGVRFEKDEKQLLVESSGGLLGDVEGFFQGLTDLPLLPLSSSSHMELLGEAQVS